VSELQYRVLSRAWYGEANLRARADSVVDEVNFGAFLPDGSCEWEASFEWLALGGGRRPPAVQLRAFDEAWEGCSFSGVFRAVGTAFERDGQVISPAVADIALLLESLGFRDVTPVQQEVAR
jgi:hypothetical protein